MGYDVRAARIELGLTKVELAEKVGAAGEAIVRSWESGRREPQKPTIMLIEQLLAAHRKSVRAKERKDEQ